MYRNKLFKKCRTIVQEHFLFKCIEFRGPVGPTRILGSKHGKTLHEKVETPPQNI